MLYSAVYCTEGEKGIGETEGSDTREINWRDGGKETEKIGREETEDRDRGGETGGGQIDGRNGGREAKERETEGRDIEMEIKRLREEA